MIFTLNFSFFSIYTFLFFNTKSLSIYNSFPLNTFISAFFISFTTLTISLSFPLAISNISTLDPLITTSTKLQIYSFLISFGFCCSYLLLLSSPIFYLVHLLFPSLFQAHISRMIES